LVTNILCTLHKAEAVSTVMSYNRTEQRAKTMTTNDDCDTSIAADVSALLGGVSTCLVTGGAIVMAGLYVKKLKGRSWKDAHLVDMTGQSSIRGTCLKPTV
jgi:hypothetical protein